MNKILSALIGLAILIVLIVNDSWRITLETSSYEISLSFVLFVTGVIMLLWFLCLFKRPFIWWRRFQEWQKVKKQEKKDSFLQELLTAFLGHQTEKNTSLISTANKIYGTKSQESLLVSALLQPQSDVFQTLNQSDSTKLAGLYGLIQQANRDGNFEEIAQLLQQVPQTQKRILWVQQAELQLALNHSDWTEALKLLEQNKSYQTKARYLSQKASLLLKLGQIKKAYQLMPTHPAIALAYAKFDPKKAPKVLKKAWHTHPCWPIYLAYKQAIQNLPQNKQVKNILALTHDTRDERYSLLARADMDMTNQNWARAKENLEIYLNKYPLTRQVADMMATLERTAWHHEQIAQDWEHKAIESEDDSLWICTSCNHTVGEWHILCPHCNAFDTLYIK